MKYLKKYKFVVLILIILIVLIIVSVKEEKIEEPILEIKEDIEKIEVEIDKTLLVDIKGAIKNPGVFELNEGDRVIDVINLSGGLLENADVSNINLSKKVYDEMVIIIDLKQDKKDNVVFVDIKGAIKNPSVYKLKENSRIIDVINLSGGLLEDADVSNINLSQKICDEMIIFIGFKEEDKQTGIECNCKEDNDGKNDNSDEINNDAAIEDDLKEEINNDASIDKELNEKDNNQNSKVSLNTATKEQLMTLPGIGESKALAIIEYRSNSLFKNIEEIMNIKGIGNSIYEKIKEYITL